MNNHLHKKETCKHFNVKYCDICDIVYCADCGYEWFKKCELSHYSSLWNQYPYTTTIHSPNITYTADSAWGHK